MANAGTLVNTSSQFVNAYDGTTTPFDENYTFAPGMIKFFAPVMLDNARDNLILTQLGKEEPLPQGNGMIMEWHQWNTLPDADVLVEGVIPTGKKFGQKAISVSLTQQGLYVPISDRLEIHNKDKVYIGATEEVGAAIGRSYEKLVRTALQLGTNILYADKVDKTNPDEPVVGTVSARSGLSITPATATYMTPDTVAQAATILEAANTPFHRGSEFVMAIHPHVAYDIRNTRGWRDVKEYNPSDLYTGEIGMLHGVRFVKSTLCPIIQNADSTFRIYQSFLVGKDAFSIVKPDGASIETIIHSKESGIGGPLNQFGTVGGKFSGAAKILYQERMVVIESTSKYSVAAQPN